MAGPFEWPPPEWGLAPLDAAGVPVDEAAAALAQPQPPITPDAVSGADIAPEDPFVPFRTGALSVPQNLGGAELELDQALREKLLPPEAQLDMPGFEGDVAPPVTDIRSQGLGVDTNLAPSHEDAVEDFVRAQQEAAETGTFHGLDIEEDIDYSKLSGLSAQDLAELEVRNQEKHTENLRAEQKRLLEEDAAREAARERRRQAVLAQADAEYADIEDEADRFADDHNSPMRRFATMVAGFIGGMQSARTGKNTLLDQILRSRAAERRENRAELNDRRKAVADMVARGMTEVQAQEALDIGELRRANKMLALEQSKYAPEGSTYLRIEKERRRIAGAEAAAAAKAREGAFKRQMELDKFRETARHNRATEAISAAKIRPRGTGGSGGSRRLHKKIASAETLQTKFGFTDKQAAAAVTLDYNNRHATNEAGQWTGGFIAPNEKIAADLNNAIGTFATSAELANRIRTIVQGGGNAIDTRFMSSKEGKELKSLSRRLVLEGGKEIVGNALGEKELEILGDLAGGDPNRLRADPESLLGGLDSMLRQNDAVLANKLRPYYSGEPPKFYNRGRASGKTRIEGTGVTQEAIDAIEAGTDEQKIIGIQRLGKHAGANPEATITSAGRGSGFDPDQRIRVAKEGIEEIDRALNAAAEKGELSEAVKKQAEETKFHLRLRIKAEEQAKKVPELEDPDHVKEKSTREQFGL